jgi:hypothetical protein
MLQKLDLAAIAEQIISPYRPIPLVSLGDIDISLFICQGTRSWHRLVPHEQLLLVTEGVITIDTAGGKMIVSEGEVVRIPRDITHNAYSGMRSTVLAIEGKETDGRFNGHPQPLAGPRGSISKLNIGVNVRSKEAFDWLASGAVGAYTASATRVRDRSALYVTPPGSLLVIVYRGVLNYRTPEEEGTLVGSQLLTIPSGTPIALQSEHGATVLLVARKGTPLPVPASAGQAPRDATAPGADASGQ